MKLFSKLVFLYSFLKVAKTICFLISLIFCGSFFCQTTLISGTVTLRNEKQFLKCAPDFHRFTNQKVPIKNSAKVLNYIYYKAFEAYSCMESDSLKRYLLLGNQILKNISLVEKQNKGFEIFEQVFLKLEEEESFSKTGVFQALPSVFPKNEQAQLFYNVRKCYHNYFTGKYDDVVSLSETSSALAKKMKDTCAFTLLLDLQTGALASLGKFKQAFTQAIQTFQLADKFQDKNIGTFTIGLSIFFAFQDNTIDADKYATIGVNRSSKYGYKRNMMLNYIEVTNSLISEKGNTFSVKRAQAIDSAIYLSRKYNQVTSLSNALTIKADNLRFNGKTGKEVVDLYAEAIALREKMDEPSLAISSCYAMGSYYNSIKEYTKAEPILLKGLALAKKNKVFSFSVSISRLLANVYENTKRPALALETYKSFTGLRDSLVNAKVQVDIKDLESKYNLTQKQNEIIKLENTANQKDLAIQKAKNRQGFLILIALLSALAFIASLVIIRLIQKQRQQLNQKNEELEKINSVKNRLFSVISHDLKSLVAPFQHTSRMINYHIEKNNPKRLKDVVSNLEGNAVKVNELLHNLLHWSKEQLEGYSIVNEEILIQNEFQNIHDLFIELSSLKQNKLLVHPTNEKLNLDKHLLNIILRNLVGNAIKFTSKGTIELGVLKESNMITLWIKDTGIGLDETQLKAIEKPISTTGTAHETGTGLGLMMVQKYTAMLGGTIKITSELDKGTLVQLKFKTN